MAIDIRLDLWPKQMMALQGGGTEVLYGGATRSGKSHLARVILISACLKIKNLSCVLIRKKYQDILDNHLYPQNGFYDVLRPLIANGFCKVTQDAISFQNGSRISFKHCFSADTLVTTTAGTFPISELTSGEIEIANGVTVPFRNARKTRDNAPLVEVRFSDGSAVKCTPDHLFITDRGTVEASQLEGCQCLTNQSKLLAIQSSFLTASSTDYSISKNISVEGLRDFTASCGSSITDQLRRAITSTTRMIISSIIKLRTSNYLRVPVTGLCTPTGPNLSLRLESISEKDANPLSYGTQAKRAESGIVNTEKTSTKKCVSVVSAGNEDVYCLTVPDYGFFALANGVVVSNCQDERQMDSAQGISTQILVIDEATQISERLIRMFRGWVTITEEMKAELPEFFKNKLPLILYTANPIGPSVGYFRREFVKARPALVTEKVGAFHRQYIPANVADNPSENAEAVRGRMNEMGDAALTKALLEGDWDQLVGEFFPEWDEERHVVPDFTPPRSYFRFRSMDLGYAEPFSVYWICVSDGEVFRDSNNRERWFPRGSFIVYREWYGCDPSDNSKGLRMRNEDIAAGIYQRSDDNERQIITLTDSLPFQDRGGDNVPKVFAKEGVTIIQGDTSRVVGWNQLRSRLIGKEMSGQRVPMIYFTESCTFIRDYLPQITRHPSESRREDAQEHGEPTHSCFVAETLVRTENGDLPISKVNGAFLVKKNAETVKLTFSDGSSVQCTPDHLFLTKDGWVPASKMVDAFGLSCMVPVWLRSYRRVSRSFGVSSIVFTPARNTLAGISCDYIGRFGSSITDLSRRVSTSIIKTITEPTISLRISNCSPLTPIYLGTCGPKNGGSYLARQSNVLSSPHQSGTKVERGESGTESTIKKIKTSFTLRLAKNAKSATPSFWGFLDRVLIFADLDANNGMRGEPSEKLGHAKSADVASTPPVSPRLEHAQKAAQPLRCIKLETAKAADVWCLQEPKTASFCLSNGLIVKNCDAVRIACMAHTVIKDGKDIRQTQIDAAMRGKMTARSLTTQNGVSIFS